MDKATGGAFPNEFIHRLDRGRVGLRTRSGSDLFSIVGREL